jgi:L,D-transpeptidase ErfK/SrfK
MIKISVRNVMAAIIAVGMSGQLSATTFNALPADESLLGEMQYVTPSNNDTPTTIAHRYEIGLNALINANSGISETAIATKNAPVKIATQHLLPPVQRRGIVVNLPEMRLYYYPEDSSEVMTYPIGIGKIGKTIPLAATVKIVRKATNPVWIPTANIREFDRKELGIDPPAVMPPGPDNPLGPYAIYLSLPTYLIHSTIYPESIGRRASFGCIRMNEADIKEFFPLVEKGVPVTLIDMPNKVAWNKNALYMESYPPLEEKEQPTIDSVINQISQQSSHDRVALIDWQMIPYITEQADGMPHEIGVQLR